MDHQPAKDGVLKQYDWPSLDADEQEEIEIHQKTKGTSTERKVSLGRYDWPNLDADEEDHSKMNVDRNPRENRGIVLYQASKPLPLINLGYSCYVNAVVQCLFSLQIFCDTFHMYHHQSIRHPRSLLEVVARYIVGYHQRNNDAPIQMRLFVSALGYAGEKWRNTRQQDAQEFLDSLLDSLHTSTNKGSVKGPIPMLTAAQYSLLDNMPWLEASEQEWERLKQRNNSPVIDMFGGQDIQIMTCKGCKTSSRTFRPTGCPLQLQLHGATGACRIEDLIASYFTGNEDLDRDEQSEEYPDGKPPYDCQVCKMFTDVTVSRQWVIIPRIICFHIGRFTADMGKATNFIRYPHSLDLTFCAQEAINTNNAYIYNLFGVVEHIGETIEVGHYKAYVKIKEKWWCCDDTAVTMVEGEQVVTKDAYLLFYYQER